MESIKKKAFTWYLRIISAIQLGLWGFSHLFYPEWYLTVMAGKSVDILTENNILIVNEVGISITALALVTLLIAHKPVKNFAVIAINYLVGIGSILVTGYHIIIRKASNEWPHILIVLCLLLFMTLLYPWKELKESRES